MFTAESEGYAAYVHRRPIWPRVRLPLAGLAAFTTFVFVVLGCLR